LLPVSGFREKFIALHLATFATLPPESDQSPAVDVSARSSSEAARRWNDMAGIGELFAVAGES
jgi:hypothetical protein